MFTESLFEDILIKPIRESADRLYIVSGYASATMAYRHLQALDRFRKDVQIELIVGMAIRDGISSKDHEGFQELISGRYRDRFNCRYVVHGPPIHSKTFAWYSGNDPKIAFIGSANYTQLAFSTSQREAIVEHDVESSRNYFDLVRQDTIECTDPQVNNLIVIHSEPEYSIKVADHEEDIEDDESGSEIAEGVLERLPHIRVNLLDNRGNLPRRSGLNWGQRPEERREPNQAYIRLPIAIARTDFFPPRRTQFTIITDDDKTLICTRAQDQAKAIHTSDSNSRMGIYFRYRLGVPEGSLVTTEDLERYGRAGVDFYKIDEETYYMDFST